MGEEEDQSEEAVFARQQHDAESQRQCQACADLIKQRMRQFGPGPPPVTPDPDSGDTEMDHRSQASQSSAPLSKTAARRRRKKAREQSVGRVATGSADDPQEVAIWQGLTRSSFYAALPLATALKTSILIETAVQRWQWACLFDVTPTTHFVDNSPDRWHESELFGLRGGPHAGTTVQLASYTLAGAAVPPVDESDPLCYLQHLMAKLKAVAATQCVQHLVLVLPSSPPFAARPPRSVQLYQELMRALTGSDEHSGAVNDAAACLAQLNIAPNCDVTVIEAPRPFLQFSADQDWFTPHIPTWERLLFSLRNSLRAKRAPLRLLELGCRDGRAAVWLLQNLLAQAHAGIAGDRAGAAAADSGVAAQRGSRLVTVDDFDLLRTPSGRKRRDDLEVNLLRTGLRRLCTVMEGFTVPALTDLLRQGAEFDFVYVAPSQDGSDVLLGAALAWRMVAQGGIVLFDSYDGHTRAPVQHPAEGIDAFVSAHRHQLEVLHVARQLAVRRTAPAFVGFEWRSV